MVAQLIGLTPREGDRGIEYKRHLEATAVLDELPDGDVVAERMLLAKCEHGFYGFVNRHSRRGDGNEPGDRLAVTRDRDRVASLNLIKELGEVCLRFINANLFHHEPRILV